MQQHAACATGHVARRATTKTSPMRRISAMRRSDGLSPQRSTGYRALRLRLRRALRSTELCVSTLSCTASGSSYRRSAAAGVQIEQSGVLAARTDATKAAQPGAALLACRHTLEAQRHANARRMLRAPAALDKRRERVTPDKPHIKHPRGGGSPRTTQRLAHSTQRTHLRDSRAAPNSIDTTTQWPTTRPTRPA